MVDIAWHCNKWYLRLILLNNAFLHTTYKLLPNPKETWKEKEFRSTLLNLGKDAIISLESKILKHCQTWWVLVYRVYVWKVRQSQFPPNNKAAWSKTKHKPKIYKGSVLSSNWFFFLSIFSSSIFFFLAHMKCRNFHPRFPPHIAAEKLVENGLHILINCKH